MDHVLNAMRPHFEVLLNWYLDEHRAGNYKKYSDNPYWRELKAVNDAMNILRKYLGWEACRLVDEIKYRLENYKK